MKHILFVDDDPVLARLLADYVANEGFRTSVALDSVEAMAILTQDQVDLIVLDVMMPKVSGLDLLKTLRESSSIPVIMLTGKGDEIDRILGLELGADDYIGKPCNPRELLARVRAVLRRSEVAVDVVQSEHWALDGQTFSAAYKGISIALTQAEYSLLAVFISNADQVMSKEQLTQQVLNRPLEQHDRAIDVHVSRLRKKLADVGASETITALRGRGYRWSV